MTPSARRVLFSALVLSFSAVGLAAASGTVAGWSRGQVRTLLADRIDVRERGVGMVVGLVDESGTLIVGHGRRSAGDGRVPDGATVFEIGSVTKVFTGILLADMVERGDVTLDQPVQSLLPESVKMPTREGRAITLLHLSTHASGLPRMPSNLPPYDEANPYVDYGADRMHEFLSGHELDRTPGEPSGYSNLAVGLLGNALADHAGKSYGRLAIERVARPLGMKDTTIRLSHKLKKRLAIGHAATREPVSNWDFQALAGAGALRSTAHDLLRFLAANAGLKKNPLADVLAATQEIRGELGAGMKMGLGWIVLEHEGRTLHWHDGGTGGYRTFVGFDGERREGVVVLSNCTHDVNDIGLHLLDRRLELADIPLPPQRGEADPASFGDKVGDYQLAPGFVMSITLESEKLFAQATGQSRVELVPESETAFFIEGLDARIVFHADESGDVGHLVLHQAGMEQKALRVGEDGTADFGSGDGVTVSEEILERHAGRYELAPGFALTVRRDGARLLAQATGQPEFELFAETETRFFYKVVDAQVTFEKDEAGNTTGLVLHQGGRDMPGRRLD